MPAVTAIANAPQKVTRSTERPTEAWPATAPSAPSTARQISDTRLTTRICEAAGAKALASRGAAAPALNVAADAVWDEPQQNGGLLRFYRALIALRKEYSALRGMDFAFLHAEANDAAIAYERRGGGERFIIAMNAGTASRKLEIHGAGGDWQDAFTGHKATAHKDSLTVELDAGGFAVYKQLK